MNADEGIIDILSTINITALKLCVMDPEREQNCTVKRYIRAMLHTC